MDKWLREYQCLFSTHRAKNSLSLSSLSIRNFILQLQFPNPKYNTSVLHLLCPKFTIFKQRDTHAHSELKAFDIRIPIRSKRVIRTLVLSSELNGVTEHRSLIALEMYKRMNAWATLMQLYSVYTHTACIM